ncbi:MAG TPA: GNAT family N-acetyltransferase [Bacteroidales bacterium]|nr:GNAT family N-acetyltransferase [Bacteroidales bacterium]
MVKIRQALPSDLPVIASFQLKMAMETEDLKLDFNTVLKGVEAVFYDDSKGKYYVAEVDNNVVACLLTTYEWSDWRNGTIIWIQSLYVEKEYRKKGIFKAMYNHIKEIVSTTDNFKGIRLYVDKSNSLACKVYKSIGMNDQHYLLFEWMKE